MLYNRGESVLIRLHQGNSAAWIPIEVEATVQCFLGPDEGFPEREYYMRARVEVAPDLFETWEGWIEQKDMLRKVEDTHGSHE